MEQMTLSTYFQILTSVLKTPRRFFRELPQEVRFRFPLAFLAVSAAVCTLAGLSRARPESPLLVGGIVFTNAVGMVLIAAFLGFGVMHLTLNARVDFARVFSIYAYSSGVTLLASWVPHFVWMTEPWKWYLIGVGMTSGLNLRFGQAFWVIALSMGTLILFFAMVLSLTAPGPAGFH